MLNGLFLAFKSIFIKKSVTLSKEEIQSKSPEFYLDHNKCIGCKTCERICPNKCITIISPKEHKFNSTFCCACKLCQHACPNKCIRWR